MGIKHLFTSAIADGLDLTKVRPSNWNANHTIDGDVNFGGFDILNCGNFTPSSFTANYLNVQDFGAVGNGSTDDAAAIQSCLDAAFGTVGSPHGNANRLLNQAVYFPPGSYRVSTPLLGRSWMSPYLFGHGKNITSISGDSAAIALNGCMDGRFEGLTFSKGGGSSIVAFALDWDNTGDVALTGNTFYQCGFGGNGSGIACAVGQSGYMGSENLWFACTFANCTTGLKCYNQNALDNSIIGGDAFSCTDAAFDSFNGQIALVIGGSYAGNGVDYKMGSTQSNVILAGIRSESTNFLGPVDAHGSATLIGVEHTGAGTFIESTTAATIVCIGCSTAGVINTARVSWIGFGTDGTPPTLATAGGLMGIDNAGLKYIRQTAGINDISIRKYPGIVVHNRGLGGPSSFSLPQLAGTWQTLVVCDANSMSTRLSGGNVYTPTGVVAMGGGVGAVDVASSTAGSSITVVCLEGGASPPYNYAVTAMTGTWSFTPI